MGNFYAIDYTRFKERLHKITHGEKDRVLAEKMHMNPSTFSKKINNKDGQQFSIDDLYFIAKEYNCSIDDLLGLNESDVQTSYTTLYDFASRLLPICEVEKHSITEIDDPLVENKKILALVFNNEEIQKILYDLKAIEDMKINSKDSRIYSVWKSDLYNYSKEKLTLIEYENTSYYLIQLASRLQSLIHTLRNLEIPYDEITNDERKMIAEYGSKMIKDLLDEYDSLLYRDI